MKVYCRNSVSVATSVSNKVIRGYLLYSSRCICLYLFEAVPVAEWLRLLIFSAVNRSSSHRCGFEPTPDHMWEKPSSACGWSGGFYLFLGISRFRPILWLTQLKMIEIILTGRKTPIKERQWPRTNIDAIWLSVLLLREWSVSVAGTEGKLTSWSRTSHFVQDIKRERSTNTNSGMMKNIIQAEAKTSWLPPGYHKQAIINKAN